MPPQLTTEESAASLGFSNALMEQLLASQNPPQEGSGETFQQEGQGASREELEAFKEEVSAMIEEKLDSIREDIANALKSDGED